MVEETIKQVKETEAEADRIVKAAEKECAAILEATSKEAQSLKEKMVNEASEKTQNAMEEEKNRDEKLQQGAMEGVGKEIEALKTMANEKEKEVVQLVFSHLI